VARKGDLSELSTPERLGVVDTCEGFGIADWLSRTNVRQEASLVSNAPTLRKRSPTMLRAERRDCDEEVEWMDDIEGEGELLLVVAVEVLIECAVG